jgi:hypothetical protein
MGNLCNLLKETAFKYISACENSGRSSRKRRYPKSIKIKLNAEHRAWLKAKLNNDLNSKEHYEDVAKECAITSCTVVPATLRTTCLSYGNIRFSTPCKT